MLTLRKVVPMSALLIILAVFIAACSKSVKKDENKRTIIPLKINVSCVKARIISISCGWYIVQSLNNDALGEDNWRAQDGNTYDNVFDIYNLCEMPDSLKPMDTVYFKLTDQISGENCKICLIGGEIPPSISYIVKDFTDISCR